ncbi:MAG: DUF1570 domain-containing protein [Planctomycetaceae bacterium]|jgi:hypothetical protein|nr:DUF1570 domain-containing protein [bacterium]MDG2388358.1 DUF1570 domain-containing protein [Planctomycetaceae bacterium]
MMTFLANNTSKLSLKRLGAVVCMVVLCLVQCAQVAEAQRLGEEEYRKKFHESQNLFYLESDQLAANLSGVGQTAHAKEIVDKLEALSVSGHRHSKLPVQVQPSISPEATPENAWKQRWRRMQNDHAAEMYSLSHQVLKQQMVGLGYRILRYVLLVNSDHAEARKMLGYTRFENEWMTPFELQKRKDGEIWDDRFGWIKQNDLKKYEQGLRPFRDRWIPEEQDQNLRLSANDLWEVRTEHWIVRTDHSLEKGVEVAKKLEDYFQFFIREFPDLFASRGQMNQLFNIGQNGRARVNKNPMQVNYFRSRDGYLKRLEKVGPLIASTNGIYLHKLGTSFFYSRPDNLEEEESTIYHEATHQILFESRGSKRDIAQEMHFWVIEGFACYMESYRNQEGEITLGDPHYIRFNNAMVRLIVDEYFVRFEVITSLGQRNFQGQQDLPKLYSQASGMVHFLMHANEGAYRDDLGKFLAAIYSPNLRSERHVPTLDKLSGKAYLNLNKEYIAYIARLAEEVSVTESTTNTAE